MNDSTTLCACGCGLPVSRGHRYRRGHENAHSARERAKGITDPNPSGLCQCGCGRRTTIIASTVVTRGLVQGHHRRFIPGHVARPDHELYAVDPETGCWNWLGCKNELGYGRLTRNQTGLKAHRWMYERMRGPIPEGLVLDHLCRNPSCVNPDHLEPVTARENCWRGAKAKLDKQGVFEARVLRFIAGWSVEDLAERYGVSGACMSNALLGEKRWRDVPMPYGDGPEIVGKIPGRRSA